MLCKSGQPNLQPQPQTLPLLTPPLWAIRWFGKTEVFGLVLEPAYLPKNPKNFQIPKNLQTLNKNERFSKLCNFSNMLLDQKSLFLGNGTNRKTEPHSDNSVKNQLITSDRLGELEWDFNVTNLHEHNFRPKMLPHRNV